MIQHRETIDRVLSLKKKSELIDLSCTINIEDIDDNDDDNDNDKNIVSTPSSLGTFISSPTLS